MEEQETQVIDTETVETPPADQTTAEPNAEDAEKREQEETEKKPWYKKRFDELTRKRYEAEEKAATERRLREDREKELEAIKREKEKSLPEFKETRPKPKRIEFEIDQDEEYAEALVDWKLEQRDAKNRAAQQHEESIRVQHEERQRANERQKTFFEKRDGLVQSGEKKFKDFSNVIQAIPAQIMHQQLAEILVDSDVGAEIAYHLGQNLQEAESISKMNPYAMAREIGKIEARLQAKPHKTTTAPPPVNTIKGKSGSSAEIDPSKDPQAWIAARNRGEI